MMQLVKEAEQPAPNAATNAAMAVIIQALRVLSQRTVIALASLFDLCLCSSVFYLLIQIANDPKPLQLWLMGGYAVFTLAVLVFRKR